MSTRTLLCTAVLATLAACSPAAPAVDVAQEAEAIRALDADFAAKANKADWAGVAAHYAADALLMPPNMKSIAGSAGIQQYWSATPPGTTVELVPTSVTVSASGELATDVGTFKVTVPVPGGSPVVDEGKYVVTWTKGAGGWRISNDIWNSDLPPMPPAPAAPAK